MARLQTPQGKRITQDEIARALGKERSVVTKYFSGLRRPPLSDALKIFRLCAARIGPLAGKTNEEIEQLAEADRLMGGDAGVEVREAAA